MNQIKLTETYKQFLYEIPHFIYQEVAKSVNQLCGLSKTSNMIATLFTTLPLQIELRHITGQPKPSKKLNALEEFVHAYIRHDDSTKVYIAFFYDTEKHITKITKAIHKHPEFFAYLYMREALKLSRLMNTATHYRMMSSIIKFNNPSIPVTEHYKYSIQACNYVVNSTLKQLFNSSILAQKFNTIIDGQAYNSKYDNKSEIDVLINIISTAPKILTSTAIDSDFTYDDYLNEVFQNNDYAILIDEEIQTDIGESISTQLGSMSRGNTSAAIFGDFFSAKKVKTGWFKKLKNKFNTDVYNITNTFRSQWSNLNIIYRQKFKSPSVQYNNNKLAVILSVDHSGSVSTEGLQKLLYLFEKQHKNISKLTVLIHDTEVVKQFDLSSDYDITTNVNFKQALAHRFAVGGTSHFNVFKTITEMLETKQIIPEKIIYICFSDMISDIPQSLEKYPSMKQLNTIWLSPISNNLPAKCGGTNITME